MTFVFNIKPVSDDDEDNDLNIDEDDFCFEHQFSINISKMNIFSLSLQVERWQWFKYPIKVLPVIVLVQKISYWMCKKELMSVDKIHISDLQSVLKSILKIDINL